MSRLARALDFQSGSSWLPVVLLLPAGDDSWLDCVQFLVNQTGLPHGRWPFNLLNPKI